MSMFTIKGLIAGRIINSVINHAKMEKLKSENSILPKNIFETVSTYRGTETNSATFKIDENIDSVQEVLIEYNFSDIRSSDIVLDIGANIGGFALNIYKKVRSVYAVEPLFIEALNRNIELNNAKNVYIIPCALGTGELNVKYNNRARKVIGLSLGDIIKFCGGHVDFIKCDCEGGEWSITLPEIMNIRRIEAEVHNFDGIHNFKVFENLLISSGFDYTKKLTKRKTMLISAKNRYIS